MLTANGIADFAPCVKASYGLTFLKKEKSSMIKNKIGIRYADIFYPFLTKILTSNTPIIVDTKVAKIVGRIMSAGVLAPI